MMTTNVRFGSEAPAAVRIGDETPAGIAIGHTIVWTAPRHERIYVLDNAADYLRAWDLSGNRQSNDDISIGGGTWEGVAATPNRIIVMERTYTGPSGLQPSVRAWDFSGNRQSDDDISISAGSWTGVAATATRIYALDNIADYLRAWDFSGNRQSDDDISIGAGGWTGATYILLI